MDKPIKRDVSKRSQFSGQHEDESVIAMARRFPVVLRWALIKGLLIILAGLIPWAVATYYDAPWQNIGTNLLIVAIVLLIWYWAREWVGWYYSIYLLTSSRLMMISQKGFFKRSVAELSLNNIQNVNYNIDGFQASMFGYGDVLIETLSGGGGFRMDHVHHPARFQQKVIKAVRAFDSTHPSR